MSLLVNREIKFKGWWTGGNEFIFFNTKSDKSMAFQIGGYITDLNLEEDTNKIWVLQESEVDEVIWCQFTGFIIKDKEVYEGDLIKTKKDFLYEVIFENGAFYLYHANKYDCDGRLKWGLLNRFFEADMKDILEQSEIIGNIYENPELLKG